MKTDNYLAMCLEQAAQSPLRYRHGAIIVRGGKVIGRGFNDYRSDFNGGVLKTGQMTKKSKPCDVVVHQTTLKSEEYKGDIKPFDMIAGGATMGNTPLSIHSEMMAIQSALSASCTSASIAKSYLKPSSRLQCDSKRKARLRREIIDAYVETVCKVSLSPSSVLQQAKQWQVQQWQVESPLSQSDIPEYRDSMQWQDQEMQQRQREQQFQSLPWQQV